MICKITGRECEGTYKFGTVDVCDIDSSIICDKPKNGGEN